MAVELVQEALDGALKVVDVVEEAGRVEVVVAKVEGRGEEGRGGRLADAGAQGRDRGERGVGREGLAEGRAGCERGGQGLVEDEGRGEAVGGGEGDEVSEGSDALPCRRERRGRTRG
mgnify:CR=1 FL=1